VGARNPTRRRRRRCGQRVKPIRVEGLLDRDIAALFTEQLSILDTDEETIRIDLLDADIEDAVVVSTLIEVLRSTAERLGQLEVFGAPQSLAHGLYRVGALGPNAKLRLIEPREEIGTSS
jgi:ABC-type transporter Mla MlaB component